MNLFSTLSKYGLDAAENQLTEAFAFLLSSFIERDPAAGATLLSRLCGVAMTEGEQLECIVGFVFAAWTAAQAQRPPPGA